MPAGPQGQLPRACRDDGTEGWQLGALYEGVASTPGPRSTPTHPGPPGHVAAPAIQLEGDKALGNGTQGVADLQGSG